MAVAGDRAIADLKTDLVLPVLSLDIRCGGHGLGEILGGPLQNRDLVRPNRRSDVRLTPFTLTDLRNARWARCE